MTEGQMSLFDFIEQPIEQHRCCECEKAKFKERTSNGISLWWCNTARAYITEYTIEAIFHKNCFERRTKWKK